MKTYKENDYTVYEKYGKKYRIVQKSNNDFIIQIKQCREEVYFVFFAKTVHEWVYFFPCKGVKEGVEWLDSYLINEEKYPIYH